MVGKRRRAHVSGLGRRGAAGCKGHGPGAAPGPGPARAQRLASRTMAGKAARVSAADSGVGGGAGENQAQRGERRSRGDGGGVAAASRSTVAGAGQWFAGAGQLHSRHATARFVDFGWGFFAERLVRSAVVEVDGPPVAVALLRSTGARRRQLELGQVAVHALMAAIVLRLSRTRADRPDAERHQPGGELRESAARPGANEGRAVVAQDRERSAVLVEKLLQDASHQRAAGARQEGRRKHEATVRIAD